MNNAKIIKLLKTFSNVEFKEFGKFLNSPFHNESLKMVRLYNYLKKFYPLFNRRDLTKEIIFGKMYGEAKYDDKKFRDRLSDLLRLAEEYLAIIHLKQLPAEFKRNTLFEYNTRRLPVHFDKVSKEIQRIIDNTVIKNTDYFINRYNNERDRSDFYQHDELLGKRKALYDEFTLEVKMFIEIFVSQMLSNYAIMHNWKNQINYKFDYSFYKSVMKFAEENDMLKFPFIKAFYLIMRIKDAPEDDKLYFQLKDTYINNLAVIDLDDKIRIGTILFNEANKRSGKDRPGFEKEAFNIMKFQLEHGIYPNEDGWMSREQYLNYVIIPVSFGEIDWAEKFVESNSNKLQPDKRKNAVSYAKSLLCFERKNYEASLLHLSTIIGGDYIYYVRIKVLHSKIFYEQKEYEKVLEVIDAFMHYLKGNVSIIPEEVVKRYTEFVRALHKLVNITIKPDNYSVERFVVDLKKSSADELTLNITWLLEKADLILKGSTDSIV